MDVGFGIQGSGSGAWNEGLASQFRDSGIALQDWQCRSRNPDPAFTIQDSGFWIQGTGFVSRNLGFRFRDAASGKPSVGFEMKDSFWGVGT